MSDQLTFKQAKFVAGVLETGNQSEAYRRAYNAENMCAEAIGVEACRLAQNPKVSLEVENAKRQAMEQAKLSKEWVINKLIENAERALQHSPVTDAKGKVTGEYVYQGSVANRALELLGKEQGMFKDNPLTVVNVDSSPSDLTHKVETARKALEKPADSLKPVSGGDLPEDPVEAPMEAVSAAFGATPVTANGSGTTEPHKAG